MLLHLRAVDKMSVYSSEAIHSSDVLNGRYAMKKQRTYRDYCMYSNIYIEITSILHLCSVPKHPLISFEL